MVSGCYCFPYDGVKYDVMRHYYTQKPANPVNCFNKLFAVLEK